VAQATIDIYAMFVVLSRASRSINLKYASAEHEANLANLFCVEASKRVAENLKDAVDSHYEDKTKLLIKIARDLAHVGRTVPQHPLGF
jgi:very long chain acyl-CoA dehydrogenase